MTNSNDNKEYAVTDYNIGLSDDYCDLVYYVDYNLLDYGIKEKYKFTFYSCPRVDFNLLFIENMDNSYNNE